MGLEGAGRLKAEKAVSAILNRECVRVFCVKCQVVVLLNRMEEGGLFQSVSCGDQAISRFLSSVR